MIRRDKQDESFVLVDYEDILMGAVASSHENKELSINYMELFSNDSAIKKEDGSYTEYKKTRRLKQDSEEVKYLIDTVGVIDLRTHIDHNILRDALTRSYYEFNHEMKNKLSIYFRKYLDNEINGIDNTILKQEIINDKELLEYIKKYDDLDEYLEFKINQHIDINEKTYKKK